MKTKKVLIIGAGWAGATAANILKKNNIEVLVVEKDNEVGGHSRSGLINDVIWEPYGAHIFHTNNERVAEFVNKYGLNSNFEHKVITKLMIDGEYRSFSWPPQIEELKTLKQWKNIQSELSNLPSEAVGDTFIDFVISMMGKTLYELFIEGYSIKQWGDELEGLSSRFAPRRIELRSDGYKRLFRDKYEYFPIHGVTPIIQNILEETEIIFSKEINITNIYDISTDFDYILLTCPLDSFLQKNTLNWKGIELKPKFIETNLESTISDAYVVNYPGLEVPFTRTIETKHATKQKVNGTILAEEYPGTNDRHYPIPTPENIYENENEKLKKEIIETLDYKVIFAGRLANYKYINQDQAILEGFEAAEAIIKEINS
ncbi:NAD(P)-binding protein [Acidimicrobiia bacterium]|jgi:UDP-galactopyranose mutase|nr:NAD(P)-binding protein [Acidimicrobiia bacterium]